MYPNSTQRLALAKTFGCVRYIYNKGIETKTKAYETKGKTLSCFDLCNGMLKQEKGLDKVIDSFYKIVYTFFPRYNKID